MPQNKLILSKNGHKQLTPKREMEKFWGDGSYPPTKVLDIFQ